MEPIPCKNLKAKKLKTNRTLTKAVLWRVFDVFWQINGEWSLPYQHDILLEHMPPTNFIAEKTAMN